jgi:hypothetical protein
MMTTEQRPLPPGRYRRVPSPGRRRAALVAGALAALVALAWVVWAGLGQASADVRWSDVGYQIHGDTAVDVTYDVGKDPDATVVCSLRALDRHKTAVGIAQVRIGPSSTKVTRRTDQVRTSAQAVTGVVDHCALAR